jgi:hypothetical protein
LAVLVELICSVSEIWQTLKSESSFDLQFLHFGDTNFIAVTSEVFVDSACNKTMEFLYGKQQNIAFSPKPPVSGGLWGKSDAHS